MGMDLLPVVYNAWSSGAGWARESPRTPLQGHQFTAQPRGRCFVLVRQSKPTASPIEPLMLLPDLAELISEPLRVIFTKCLSPRSLLATRPDGEAAMQESVPECWENLPLETPSSHQPLLYPPIKTHSENTLYNSRARKRIFSLSGLLPLSKLK